MTQISRLIGLYQKHNLYGDSYWSWAISFYFDSQRSSRSSTLLIIPDIHYENFCDEYWKLSIKVYFHDDKGWYCWQWQPAPVLSGTWRQNCLPRYQFWTHMIARVVVMMMIIDYHYNFNSDYYSQGWLSDVEPTQADGNSAAVLNASPQRKCRIFSFIWSSVVWKKRSLRVDDDDGSDQEDRLVPCGKL